MTICIRDIPSGSSLSDLIVVNETPVGLRDCINNSFRTKYPFIEGYLEPYVDGVKIDPTGYIEHVDNQGFTFLIDPNDPKKLNRPIMNTETLTVNYIRPGQMSGIITI